MLVHPVISGGAEGDTGLLKDDEGIKPVSAGFAILPTVDVTEEFPFLITRIFAVL